MAQCRRNYNISTRWLLIRLRTLLFEEYVAVLEERLTNVILRTCNRRTRPSPLLWCTPDTDPTIGAACTDVWIGMASFRPPLPSRIPWASKAACFTPNNLEWSVCENAPDPKGSQTTLGNVNKASFEIIFRLKFQFVLGLEEIYETNISK
jgi:hypothetical protein